jgi:hypothetical protein
VTNNRNEKKYKTQLPVSQPRIVVVVVAAVVVVVEAKVKVSRYTP